MVAVIGRCADETLEGIFLRVKRLMDGKIDLGTAPAVTLLETLWGL